MLLGLRVTPKWILIKYRLLYSILFIKGIHSGPHWAHTLFDWVWGTQRWRLTGSRPKRHIPPPWTRAIPQEWAQQSRSGSWRVVSMQATSLQAKRIYWIESAYILKGEGLVSAEMLRLLRDLDACFRDATATEPTAHTQMNIQSA